VHQLDAAIYSMAVSRVANSNVAISGRRTKMSAEPIAQGQRPPGLTAPAGTPPHRALPTWIDEFVGCLSGSTLGEVQIEKAIKIKNQHLPERIYKYRALQPERSKNYALCNLSSDTVWLCSASKYNDPYDCAITISTDDVDLTASRRVFDSIASAPNIEKLLSPEELEAARDDPDPLAVVSRFMLTKLQPAVPEKHDKMLAAVREPVHQNIRVLVEALRAKIQASTKICSFCAIYNCPVMWSHYAANHEGFCIEYDVQDLPLCDIRRRMLMPVIYSDTRFDAARYIVEAIKGNDHFNKIFPIVSSLCKSISWSYEEEWRLVFPFGLVESDTNYSMPTPRRVFFGLEISENDKEDLLRICLNKNIAPFQMKLLPNSFRLGAEPIAPH
jgi:hypothetical protein